MLLQASVRALRTDCKNSMSKLFVLKRGRAWSYIQKTFKMPSFYSARCGPEIAKMCFHRSVTSILTGIFTQKFRATRWPRGSSVPRRFFLEFFLLSGCCPLVATGLMCPTKSSGQAGNVFPHVVNWRGRLVHDLQGIHPQPFFPKAGSAGG